MLGKMGLPKKSDFKNIKEPKKIIFTDCYGHYYPVFITLQTITGIAEVGQKQNN